MEVANKTCKSNPNCNDCSECMKGSPYRFCCKDECGEHEFCRGCAYRDSRKQIRDSIGGIVMVEVIKHGEKNIIDCNFCGAQLRYSVNDIKEEKYLYQRDSYFEKYIVCPDCKNKVVIK